MSNARIPRATLERARRTLCRQVASAIVAAMAQADITFVSMGARLNEKPERIKNRLDTLIAGRQVSLRHISDMLFACGGAELRFTLIRREPENPNG